MGCFIATIGGVGGLFYSYNSREEGDLGGDDMVFWRENKNGNFTVRSLFGGWDSRVKPSS